MKKSACILILVGLAASHARAQTQAPDQERLGVYDSRSVAIAYAGSQCQKAKMNDLKARYDKARQAHDAQETARLEAQGKAWQAELHRQGFGTAPVDDLLACIEGEISRIQREARVARLVSQWNEKELGAGAERIDVTSYLVDAFHPDPLQRKRAMEIRLQKPASFAP